MSKLFIGLGSFHGDDHVGWKVAESLEARGLIAVRQASVPADLLHWLDGVEELYLCDACQGIGHAGTLHHLPWQSGFSQVLSLRSSNSHQVSLPAVLQVAESLGILPRQVVLFAIEGQHFGAGEPLSPALEARLPGVVDHITSELAHA